MRILIAGAGIGGLALAHALRRVGIDVVVYERDATPRTRGQGYRIHIDPDGNAALRACLPPAVRARVWDSGAVNGDLVAAYTQNLDRVMARTFPDIGPDELTHVDRDTFRRALLTGLGDTVRFGHELTGFRVLGPDRVRVAFAGGDVADGDLLVGADGVGSAVRGGLLPGAVVRDLGLRCLYGRMVIDDGTAALIPPDFHRGFCWVADGRGYGAGFAAVRFRNRSVDAVDYLMTTLVATPEQLGRTDGELFAASSAELRGLAVEATAAWHPTIGALFSRADAFFPVVIRASERVDAWPAGPVTLLGDAAHTMPPTGGVGANTALRDAATLAGELTAARLGEKSLRAAVTAYEDVMRPRGFDTVDAALRNAAALFPDAA